MAIEWLVVWGVTQAVGFTFKPILEELAKDATKDWVKDIFKGCLSNVIKLPQQEPLEIAAGKALKEFLELFQQELQFAEIDDHEIRQYINPLKKYLKLKLVQEILGSAFNLDIRNIDYSQLNRAWQDYQYPYQLPTLPDEFDWNRLGKQYLKKVKAIIQDNSELRDLLNTNLFAEIADNSQNDIKPDFNLTKYQETLRERYGNLPLDGLDASILDRRIRLWGIFIAQKVRECQEYLPKVYEIPKEYQRRLQESGQLERELTLEELERLQKMEFIEKWHTLTCDNERDKQRDRKRLQQAIDNSSSIQELAGNPLLLTMMAILNRSQELPRDRAELYNQCSRILLYQWDIGRTLIEDKRIDHKLIDYKDKQAMCRQIAYFMQSNEKGLAGNLMSGDDLEKILQNYLKTIEFSHPREIAKLIIHQLRHRNFILCLLGAEYYAFVHRTFLEYFCASEFVWRFKESQILSLEELKTEVFGKHWQDEFWHEVLRLIAGQIEPKFVEEVIKYLMSQEGEANRFMNLFLAADCLNEVRNRKEIQEIGDRLLVKIKALVHSGNAQDAFDRRDLKKHRLIASILLNSMKAIATVWQDSEYLKTRALSDENEYVRRTAIAQLAQQFREDPDTLEFLKTRALSDEDEDVRSTAIEQLAQQFREDPDTLEILKTRALSDENGSVRSTAIAQLAQQFREDPTLFEFLSQCAVNDPFKREEDWEKNPRQTALECLVKLFPNYPQLAALLKDRLNNDSDEKVKEYVRTVMR